MRSPRRRGHAVVAAMLVSWLLIGAAPAWSVTDEEVEQARLEREAAAAERAAALQDLDEAIAAYEAVNAEYQELTYRVGLLRGRIDEYEGEVAGLEGAVRDRAVDAYMHGDREDAALLFASSSVQHAVVVSQIMTLALEGDVESLDALVAAKAEMERLREELDQESDRVSELRFEAELIADRMYELFDEAEAELATAETELGELEAELEAQRRREEEERRRREEEQRRQEALRAAAQAGAAGGVSADLLPGFICPVAGATTFVDSWGAPRSGGRTHKGTDLMARRGTPLVAVANGTVQYGYSSLGGNTAWVYSDYGAAFFYAHLDAFAPELSSGDYVTIGTVIGTVGDTGNPAPGAYHLHFGIYPTGSGAVNPYPSVRAVCP